MLANDSNVYRMHFLSQIFFCFSSNVIRSNLIAHLSRRLTGELIVYP